MTSVSVDAAAKASGRAKATTKETRTTRIPRKRERRMRDGQGGQSDGDVVGEDRGEVRRRRAGSEGLGGTDFLEGERLSPRGTVNTV